MRLRPSDATNLIDQDTGRRALSHSRISSLVNCPRRHEFEYVHKLELVERPRPLGMGRAFQLALEHEDPEVGVRALRAEARVFSQADEDRVRVEEQVVRSASSNYLGRWRPRPGPGHTAEYGYRTRLRNPATGRLSRRFDLLGYADAIDEHDGHIELTENKLVGQVDQRVIRRLPLDRQVSLACYGLWRATGKSVRVVHYRLIRKPSIKQRQGESIDGYLERLAADYDERFEDFYCTAESLFRSADDLLRIEAELWAWAQMLAEHERRGFWPRNTSFCHEYGGCPFIPLCVGDPDAGALYQRKPRRSEERAALKPLLEAA